MDAALVLFVPRFVFLSADIWRVRLDVQCSVCLSLSYFPSLSIPMFVVYKTREPVCRLPLLFIIIESLFFTNLQRLYLFNYYY